MDVIWDFKQRLLKAGGHWMQVVIRTGSTVHIKKLIFLISLLVTGLGLHTFSLNHYKSELHQLYLYKALLLEGLRTGV